MNYRASKALQQARRFEGHQITAMSGSPGHRMCSKAGSSDAEDTLFIVRNAGGDFLNDVLQCRDWGGQLCRAASRLEYQGLISAK